MGAMRVKQSVFLHVGEVPQGSWDVRFQLDLYSLDVPLVKLIFLGNILPLFFRIWCLFKSLLLLLLLLLEFRMDIIK